ncbi:MAG TPA: AAA family ATPase, partial [Thermomicrobiales bacterium]|nr:AAA family ATPase [Thermomicrobiales bacterium]
MQPDTPHVFISYDRADSEFARLVREHLAAHGVPTWMDQYDIQPGAYWPDAIDAALSAAETVVGVLSPQAVESRNVKNEWDWAIAHERRLLLLQIEPCEVPHRYISLNFIDASESNQSAALATLARSLGVLPAEARNELTRSEPGGAPLSLDAVVGRERERDELREALARALDGSGSLVLIGGEAGIGKTTLARDVTREAETLGCLVLSGGCYDLTTTPPYGPWTEIISAYPDDDLLPPVPGQLRAAGGMAGIDSQPALFDLASRFLRSVAARRPLVIVLEDLHWADAASLDLLRHVARSIGDSRLLLVATYRHDEITGEHPLAPLLPPLVRESRAHRLDLQRLDETGVLEIARQRYLLSTADEERLLDYLDRLAEGNPFFTHELLHMLDTRRLLRPVAGGWELGDLAEAGVPALIQQVITGRLARLGGATRELLELAAIVGFEPSLDLLRRMWAGSVVDVDAALREAHEQHVLMAQPRRQALHFQHALVRQAIYDGMSLMRRRELHQRAGELLAERTNPDPTAIASHFYEAGDERALEWLCRTAEQAERLFAPEAVIAACGQALELAKELGAVAPPEMHRLRGRARESVGDFDGALGDLERVLELALQSGDARAEWQALLDLGALWASRDYQRTREYCEQAVELSRGMDDPAALGHSLNRLGNWHANAERPVEAMRFHDEALAIFERIGDRHGIAATLDLRGATLQMSGHVVRSLQSFSRSIPLLRQLDDRQTLASSLANAAGAAAGDWGLRAWRPEPVPASIGTDSNAVFAEAVEIARDIEWRAGESHVIGGSGMHLCSLGELRGGLRQLSESLSIALSIRHHQWTSHAHFRLGSVCLEVLNPARALEHLQQASGIATMVASSFFETGIAGGLASAHIQLGAYEDAARALHRRVDFDLAIDMMSTRICWFATAELHLAQGHAPEALKVVDRLIESIPAGPGSLSPDLMRLRGEILLAHGRLDEGESEFDDALAVAIGRGYPLIHWRILDAQRRLYRMRGQRPEAVRAEEDARAIVDRLADQLDDEELRATFLTN